MNKQVNTSPYCWGQKATQTYTLMQLLAILHSNTSNNLFITWSSSALVTHAINALKLMFCQRNEEV